MLSCIVEHFHGLSMFFVPEWFCHTIYKLINFVYGFLEMHLVKIVTLTIMYLCCVSVSAYSKFNFTLKLIDNDFSLPSTIYIQ